MSLILSFIKNLIGKSVLLLGYLTTTTGLLIAGVVSLITLFLNLDLSDVWSGLSDLFTTFKDDIDIVRNTLMNYEIVNWLIHSFSIDNLVSWSVIFITVFFTLVSTVYITLVFGALVALVDWLFIKFSNYIFNALSKL